MKDIFKVAMTGGLMLSLAGCATISRRENVRINEPTEVKNVELTLTTEKRGGRIEYFGWDIYLDDELYRTFNGVKSTTVFVKPYTYRVYGEMDFREDDAKGNVRALKNVATLGLGFTDRRVTNVTFEPNGKYTLYCYRIFDLWAEKSQCDVRK